MAEKAEKKGRPGGGGRVDEATGSYLVSLAAPMRTPRDVEPLVSELELNGGRLVLWPETRRRLASRLRRRPTPIGRPATRHQRWGADIAADMRLDALIASAEAGGIIEVRDVGALQIIELARPAGGAPDQEDPDVGPDDGPADDGPASAVWAGAGVAPLRWAAGRRR